MSMLRYARPSLRVFEAALLLMLALALVTAVDRLRAASPLPASVERVLDRRPAGERAVDTAARRLAARPENPGAMAQLASAFLVRARETGDPTYYGRAETLLHQALGLEPDGLETMIGLGSLALARHEFPQALVWGQRAVERAPHRSAAYGVVSDALVELGRYEEAIQALQHMVDLRPDQPALTRVSYLRELHGDLDGAIAAMGQAIQAGAPDSEGTAWSEVQLGHLRFTAGDLGGAWRAYEQSTWRVEGYVYGIAGLARVRAALGDLSGAAAVYEEVVRVAPLPEFLIALGDVYQRLGNTSEAQHQLTLLEAIQKLLVENGVRTNLEMALFYADHDLNLEEALALAQSEYAIRPTVQVADILAWALYRSGDVAAALPFSEEALRLGIQDPLVLYHAGVIAEANGRDSRALELLRLSSRLNPNYSILWSEDLARRLSEHSGGGGLE